MFLTLAVGSTALLEPLLGGAGGLVPWWGHILTLLGLPMAVVAAFYPTPTTVRLATYLLGVAYIARGVAIANAGVRLSAPGIRIDLMIGVLLVLGVMLMATGRIKADE